MSDLLIELFSEEIPARMQARAREDLKSLVTNGLVEAGLTYASAGAFSTPRRLTLTLDGLSSESRPVKEERKGPRTDAPKPAIAGFLKSTGLKLEELTVQDDKKGKTQQNQHCVKQARRAKEPGRGGKRDERHQPEPEQTDVAARVALGPRAAHGDADAEHQPVPRRRAMRRRRRLVASQSR